MGVQLKRTTDNKLVIQEITPKGPAEKAGFMVGDIISSIDGNAVKGVPDLVRYLQTKEVWRYLYRGDSTRMARRFLIQLPFFEMEEE